MIDFVGPAKTTCLLEFMFAITISGKSIISSSIFITLPITANILPASKSFSLGAAIACPLA